MRLLYVEDDPHHADLAVRRLRKTTPHVEVETVSTVREALARLDRMASEPLDLVLADVHLRDGDGLSLLRHIREHSLPLAVVLITGSGDEETAVAALKARADDYVVKDKDYLDRLPVILESALNHYRADAARRAHPLNILYVEEESGDVETTRRHFAVHADHLRLEIVSTGLEAIAALRPQDGGARYDVLLLSFDLPGMDALELFRELRLTQRQEVPAVLLCRPEDEELTRRGVKLGGATYLLKQPGYLYRLPWELEEAHYRADLLRREAALRASEARNRAILNAIPDLMFLQSRDGTYLDYHATDDRLLLLPPEQFLGKNMAEVMPPRLAADFPRCFERALATDRPVLYEYTLDMPDGVRAFEASIVSCDGDKILSIVRDITERKRAEGLLRESEARFRTLSESAPVLIWVNGAGGCEYVNRQYLEFVGAGEVDVLGYDWAQFVHAEDRRAYLSAYLAAVERRTMFEAQCRLLRRDGEYRWMKSIGLPRLSPSGDFLGYVGTTTDVTDIRQAQEALRESEAKLESELADAKHLQQISSRLMLHEDDIQALYGQILDAAIALLKSDAGSIQLLDRETGELRLLAWKGFDPESAKFWERLRPDSLSSCGAALGTGERVIVPDIEACEFMAGTEDLASYRLSGLRAVQSTPLVSRSGRLVGMISTHWREAHEPSERELRLLDVAARQAADLLERKQAQEALRESEARLRMAQQAARVATWEWNIRTGVRVWSEMIWGLLGLEPGGVAQTLESYTEFIHPEDRDRVLRKVNEVVAAGEEYDDEFRIIRRDGEVLWLASKGRVIRSADGRPERMLGVNIDITVRKLAEESLKSALAEVRQLRDRLQEENVYLQEEVRGASNFDEIIGSSEALRRVLRQAEKVAPADTAVLILGETGTGKELFAHAIHSLSPRKRHTLVKVNCATLPEHLIESELFGHERGSFTGAVAQRRGRFELADGGTLFLDEVGELPPELQAKLLRVLEEGEFERVGGSRTLRVNVRLIAATNRRLEESVREGTFRSDLYYRLSVYPVRLPALRERREDIPALVSHFVRQLAKKMGKEIETVPQDAMAALQNYDWPGNIRELRNVIERAMIITRGPALRLSDDMGSKTTGDGTPFPPPPFDAEPAQFPAAETLEQGEYNLILRTLKRVNWKVEGPGGAAELLDIHPSTLRTRMKKLGITRSSIQR